MAVTADGDKRPAPGQPELGRHVYGPRPVAALLPALLRPAFKRRSPVAARILTDWETIVGPVLGALTVPRRLAAGTLVLGCSGPLALELQHVSDQLAARINAHVGSPAVARIRLVQEYRPSPVAPVARANLAASEQAAVRAVADLPAGPLRCSLLRLGRRVLANNTSY